MKLIIKLIFVFALLVTMFGTSSAADVDFQEQLQKLAKTNAKDYIGPFSTAFGSGMNSGLYHTAKPHSFLGFDISVKMAYVSVPDEDQVFDFDAGYLPLTGLTDLGLSIDSLSIDMSIMYPERESQTVFGENQAGSIPAAPSNADSALTQALLDTMDQTFIDGIDQAVWDAMKTTLGANLHDIPTPRGIGISGLPIIIPQVSLGLLFQTEVTLRYLPSIDAGKVGNIDFLGIGVKHNIDQYIPIPLFPLDISAQFFWQKLNIGDLLESNHIAYNLQVSKKIGIGISITPFLGIGLESSTLDVEYKVDAPNVTDPAHIFHGQTLAFDLEGKNTTRITGGFTLALGLMTINADYSIGEYNTASVGLGLTLR